MTSMSSLRESEYSNEHEPFIGPLDERFSEPVHGGVPERKVPIENIGSCSVDVDMVEVDGCHTPMKRGKILETPYEGMCFDTVGAAEKYYEEYGRQEGFWIRTRTSNKHRWHSNQVVSKKFVCSHEGHYNWTQREKIQKEKAQKDIVGNERVMVENIKKRRSNSTIKCGCKSTMRVLNDEVKGKWIVTVFNDNHNHKLVSPAKRIKMRSNRHMPKAAMDMTEVFHRENLQVGKVASVLGGNQIGFDDRDCWNYLRSVRHKELEQGDAHSVLDYFRKKQIENPQFFYAKQCDQDGRAVNFFWVDATSRMSYQQFGDVISFDTTYRTNKYDMPFAPFTGVNHHLQSIQFGCALLQDETEATFCWLFETWLQAMGGHPPVSIITDQDLAIRASIAKVFPSARHRLCLWHIKKKFAEKLSQIYFKKSNFKRQMKECICKTYKVEDFEEKWSALVSEYGLQENEWLKQLYQIRSSWVPVYNRGTFFAGMNTTGRSEGMNAFYDMYLTSKTNLREFVKKYEAAMERIVKRENDEDFESEHKYRIVDDDAYLLKHAAKFYTRYVFEKFKEEWSRVNQYGVVREEIDTEYNIYLVKSKKGDPEEFLVRLKLTNLEGGCGCQYFEFMGILCRHILKVFLKLDIDDIPTHFLLKRWMQEANKFRILDGKTLVSGHEYSEALRLSHMCRHATQLACYAAKSDKTYTIYIEGMHELSERIFKVENDVVTTDIALQPSVKNSKSSQVLLLDPNISQTKGRKKDDRGKEKINNSSRLKSGIEKAQRKKRRKCALCKGFGHDKRICPENPNRKKSDSTKQISDDDQVVEEFDEDTESDQDVMRL